MDQEKEPIATLDKVTLLMEAGIRPETMNLTTESVNFQFIFGLGTEGLTPFEYQLTDMKESEEIKIEINVEQMQETFRHLLPLPVKIPAGEKSVFFKIKIIKVTKAEPKEVIKAMAEIAACGDYCCGH